VCVRSSACLGEDVCLCALVGASTCVCLYRSVNSIFIVLVIFLIYYNNSDFADLS